MALKEKMAKGQKPTTDEKFEMKSKILDDKIEHKARMKKILKPEQFLKWEQHQENRKEKMSKKNQNKRKNALPDEE